MARRLLARRLALTGCACATLVVAAGCQQAGNTGTSVTGSTLSIYLSVPPGTVSQEEKDVLDAEQLAFNQAAHRLGKFRLQLLRSHGGELSDNARTAIVDSSTIAYLGELAPGSSADTIGITNAQDVLQVSPTDTAVELTRSTPAIANTPTRYYEALSTYGRTFARVVPTTAAEARAVVAEMRSQKVPSVSVTSDGSPYGIALKAAFLGAAKSSLRTDLPASSAAAVFYAGSSTSGAAHIFDQAVSTNSKVKLFAPSALASDTFAASLSAAAQRNLYVSSPGITPAGGPATYHHAPATQAVFGFAAMQAVLHALQRAGSSASNRKTVIQDFFAIRSFGTAAGAISIDNNGDVSFSGGPPFVFSRVKGGKLTPVTAARG
jgi:ABC-type branched-subunit amino acid transport system substrate-binding protein